MEKKNESKIEPSLSQSKHPITGKPWSDVWKNLSLFLLYAFSVYGLLFIFTSISSYVFGLFLSFVLPAVLIWMIWKFKRNRNEK